MERARWPDERIDERMTAIDQNFERGFEEMREMRAEMRAMRSDLAAELRAINGRLTHVGFGLAVVFAAALAAPHL